jgi:hypothetical protein
VQEARRALNIRKEQREGSRGELGHR